ncbi:MAG: hypothetical protein ABWZ66_06830 [Pyrinomonadaceae bacterium]
MPEISENKKISVDVRMYRQGLGDCFLLTFKRAEKSDFHMMIDCGLLQGTENSTEIMTEVAENIRQTTAEAEGGKGRIDVVAVTHEHWDHISGFSQARAVFDNIDFKEVWVGWTEDDNHPQSKPMRERFRKQILGLQAALTQMDSDRFEGMRENVRSLVEEFFATDVLGANKMGRSETWEYILGKGLDRKFCSPGKILTHPELEGVRFYILGPPEDYETFTKTEPSKKDAESETYRDSEKFALADSVFAAVTESNDIFDTDANLPFERDPRIMVKADDQSVNTRFESYFASENDWRKIDDDWMMMVGQLALNLDSYTNNSCLAFAIELVESGKILLFPGDAQFGNWISWKDLSWEILDKHNHKTTVTTADLLNRTVLYKVGHHGSHNATLREHGLEMMNSPELVAMIPVDRKKAASKTTKTNPKGWEMPQEHLFKRLQEKAKGRVIIADEATNDDLDIRCSNNKLHIIEKETFLGKVKFAEEETENLKPLYVKYVIEE